VEEPLRTVVAGMIGGALMGMIFVTHLALLLVYNPPKALMERAVESNVSSLITMLAIGTFLFWNAIAIAMSFAAEATLTGDTSELSIAPAPMYLFIVLLLVAFISIPAFVFLHDRKRHLLGELMVFVGIFGLLIPNLVVAVQGTQI
jgi:hypothetical protein